MFFIILLAVVVIVGIFLKLMADNFGGDFIDTAGVMLISAGGLFLVIFSVAAIVTQTFQNQSNLLEYQQDKAYIENAYNNENLTDTERAKVMELIVKNNTIITKCLCFRDSFFWGAFYPYMVGDLPLFDVNKVRPVKHQISIAGGK